MAAVHLKPCTSSQLSNWHTAALPQEDQIQSVHSPSGGVTVHVCVCASQARPACMTWHACCLGLHTAALGHYQLPCPAPGYHRSVSWLKLGTIALDTDLTHPHPGHRVSAFQLCQAASTSVCTQPSKPMLLAGFRSGGLHQPPQPFVHNLHT